MIKLIKLFYYILLDKIKNKEEKGRQESRKTGKKGRKRREEEKEKEDTGCNWEKICHWDYGQK